MERVWVWPQSGCPDSLAAHRPDYRLLSNCSPISDPFALPPSFLSGLNPTILGDHVSRAGDDSRSSSLAFDQVRSTALQRWKARRSIVPSVPWIHDVLTHSIHISFVVRILGAFTRLRYPNGLFRASSMGLPYPLEKEFYALTSRVCRTQLS